MPTVVVIDEDAAMRALICEWLDAAGYAVGAPSMSADQGDDVEDIDIDVDVDIDLVVIDIPDLRQHGAQTVRDKRARFPRAAVIGMSTRLGRSLPPGSHLASALGVGRLLGKPLARDELLAAVAQAVGAAR